MDIKNLSIFVEVCRCGSISKAAERCFVSRQGISQIIARLEEDIQHPLLDRTNSGVAPTPAGQILMETANEILASYDRCLNRIEKLSVPLQLDIVFAPGAYNRLSSVIMEFLRKNPDHKINIMERIDSECEEYVKTETVELAFTPGPIFDNVLSANHLLTIPYTAFFKKDNPLSKKDEISLQDLEGKSVVVQGPNHKIYTHLNRQLSSRNISAEILFVYDALMQFDAVRDVEDPDIIAITSDRVGKNLMTDTMRCVPLNPMELAWNLNVVKLKDRKLSPLAKALYDMILRYCRVLT